MPYFYVKSYILMIVPSITDIWSHISSTSSFFFGKDPRFINLTHLRTQIRCHALTLRPSGTFKENPTSPLLSSHAAKTISVFLPFQAKQSPLLGPHFQQKHLFPPALGSGLLRVRPAPWAEARRYRGRSWEGTGRARPGPGTGEGRLAP